MGVSLITGPVAWAAGAGILINLLSARLFGHDHHHDPNQRKAVLHLLTDAAVSMAVLVSALDAAPRLTAHVVIDPDRLAHEGFSRDQLLEQAHQRLEAVGIRKSTLLLESAAQPYAPL